MERQSQYKELTSLFPDSKQSEQLGLLLLQVELKPGGDITCMIDCAVVQRSAPKRMRVLHYVS